MSGVVVEVWRGSLVESRHRVSVAVADAGGRLRAGAGDPGQVTYARSAVKPIQTLPLIEDGAADRFGLTADELALCCASHSGEPVHVRLAESILRKIGSDEAALACGAHAPWNASAARALREAGSAPTRLHNNCSGKHAGMLALARAHGWPLAGYHRADHPVQRRLQEEIARWAGLAPEDLTVGVDGCGVPTFALSLTALAGAFARVAASARQGGTPAARVVNAMVRHPEVVGGTGRLCTDLLRTAEGRIFAKIGAEGVYCAGIPGAELGIALKVEDGARRAAEPALIGVLRALGLLSDEEMAELGPYAAPDLENTRGDVVGRIRAEVTLEAGSG